MIEGLKHWIEKMIAGLILTLIFAGLGWIIGMWFTGINGVAVGCAIITGLLFAFGAIEADAHGKK